jgi:hypothetical protein
MTRISSLLLLRRCCSGSPGSTWASDDLRALDWREKKRWMSRPLLLFLRGPAARPGQFKASGRDIVQASPQASPLLKRAGCSDKFASGRRQRGWGQERSWAHRARWQRDSARLALATGGVNGGWSERMVRGMCAVMARRVTRAAGEAQADEERARDGGPAAGSGRRGFAVRWRHRSCSTASDAAVVRPFLHLTPPPTAASGRAGAD